MNLTIGTVVYKGANEINCIRTVNKKCVVHVFSVKLFSFI